ncbi:DMT family transporter [Vibrio cholerae]|uniref:DMT family transporter n=1 Tax=Vibrio cholerae TaxID=666 RepID=UPI00053C8F09|nr:DMT family transporter [Vibrio cholerae]EGR4156522.1 DMT family transporter [Vibrio cholerae]EJL6414904.1 DMT family transporter [Vibrio cholerae]EJL6450463.1 DMT family transporter [Vibrio cholerae]EKF9217905.1 DMT family transporter [Vibrio cholerae]NOF78391.1 DMT family transporter [Vibrio cholerae]
MNPVALAVWLLVLGNLAASLSDVAVKMLQGEVVPFQYMFLRQLFAFALIWPVWRKQPKALRQLHDPKVTLIRAHLVLLGAGCMVVAISYLPLATANAVFYAAPLLMLPLSILFLKERPSRGKVISTVTGFLGVLIVLRPSQFHWAALFALGTACSLALFNLLARTIPERQPVVTTLMWTTLFSLPISGLLAAAYWQPLSLSQWLWIAASSGLILLYNGLAVAAYQKAPASQIALAEYSGLIFVAAFGAFWFAEMLDALTWLGIGMIILPLLPSAWLAKWWELLTAPKATIRETEEHH